VNHDLSGRYSPPDTNFLERLSYWAVAAPDREGFRYLEPGDGDDVVLTYAQLDESAKAIAAQLVSMGFVGQRALLLYPPGLEFVKAFFACHYAGVIPVPAYPPRRNRNMGRINLISENCNASVALTVDSVISRSANRLDDAPNLRRIPWIDTEVIPLDMASDWITPKIRSDDVGLIQYTSGSTGNPKGVVLTHSNLIANCRMITKAFSIPFGETNAVTWLPAYHDMGLVGGILNPVYCGVSEIMVSPVSILRYPIRWLRAISDYKAAVTGGPNFAYAWCVQKITEEQCEGLDLSCWEVAFNGAEPVRADVMDLFTKKFAPYGFRAKTHYPCYGMAETTLLVTGGKRHEEPIVRSFDRNELVQHRVVPVDPDDKVAHDLVGCGQVLDEEEVLIVHPETLKALPDDQIGEIWINSPSCGVGYWERPEASEETFGARLNPDNGKKYVRSGDLGFMDRGELFIAGRLKDMIIVRGVNRYPQDIEATVDQCDPRTRSGCSAAIAITRWDREHLVIVCEVERGSKHREWGDVFDAIREKVTEEHDLPPDAIVLVRAYSIPKTSSGKVQRHACQRDFENNDLIVIDEWISWEEGERATRAKLTRQKRISAASDLNGRGSTAEVMDDSKLSPVVVDAVIQVVEGVGGNRARNVDINTSIVKLGLDSMERLSIANSLEQTFGGHLPEEVLQEVETVREVAAAIQEHIGTEPVSDVPPGQGAKNRLKGPIPESYYKLEKMPEYVRLNAIQTKIASTGIRNPYFSVHEGRIGDTTKIDGKELISYASYNYLGLSGSQEVNEAAKNAIDQFGTSVSASRIVSGEKTIHRELESEIADFLSVEDVITFPGGHATNETVIGHLVGPGDLIVHDSFAHNSIVQGAELSGARRRPFEHNNWRDLFDVLESSRNDYKRVLIVIEGLYSMDGDFPDLPRFVDIKEKFKCWLYVDEAHSIGTLGKTGRGLAEVFGVDRNRVECWMGTLSKSFGSCGGFIAGQKSLVEYLRYTTPGYIFAAGMPPANVGAALGSLRVLKNSPHLVSKLQENSKLFLQLCKDNNLDTGMAQGTPIIPIICGDSIKALQLSEGLYNRGINAQPILYPAVPEKETRIRIFMTAIHSEQQIRDSVGILAEEYHRVFPERTGKPVSTT
jgi:8-amino-7-oxononanoate synthase